MITPQILTDHWPLTNVSLGETFQSYYSRKVFRIHAKEGEFVAKVENILPTSTRKMKPYEIFDFLTSRHFLHIPTLMKSRDGLFQVDTNHHSMAVMEFIDGGHPEPNPLTWETLGQIAKKLNSITDFPLPYGIDSQGAIEELTEQANCHPSKKQFLEYIALLSPLTESSKQGLVHGEINLSNVMRRKNGELVLIDWDHCGTGNTIIENGYPLLTVFLTENLCFQQELAAAFYRGYYENSPPDDDEKELLFRSALLHALRYMQFANQKQRWERIRYAVAHKNSLLAAIF